VNTTNLDTDVAVLGGGPAGYRQAITSAGTGAAAALDAEHWLAARYTDNNKENRDAVHAAR
jgi:flavin-dependent dehydrogenase